MRKREEIEGLYKFGAPMEVELLLDIRDLLQKPPVHGLMPLSRFGAFAPQKDVVVDEPKERERQSYEGDYSHTHCFNNQSEHVHHIACCLCRKRRKDADKEMFESLDPKDL